MTDSGGSPATSVAVCGLGVMGGGIARRLLELGVPVHVWNRSPDKAEQLSARGAVVHGTPAVAAAHAEVVMLSVADGKALTEVAYGADGVLAGRRPTGSVLCAGTVAPAEVARIASRAPSVLDIGLLGNGTHAVTGQLRLYVGGPVAVLDPVRPLLDSLAKQVVHVGEIGSGMRFKLVMNLLMGVEMQAMAEAVGLATASGLDRDLVLDAIRASGFASPVMSYKAQRMAANRFDDPDFRLAYMAKDLGLAVTDADAAQVTLPVTQATAASYAEAVVAGLGEQDCAAIIRAVVPGPVEARR